MRVTTALLGATALLSTTVSAAISIGTIAGTNGVSYNVAWTTGTSDPCNQDTKFLSTFPANPCGHSFQLGSDAGLTLGGCGGPLWINQNGEFKDNCVSAENLDKQCGSNSFWIELAQDLPVPRLDDVIAGGFVSCGLRCLSFCV